jgi:hypothetical protein
MQMTVIQMFFYFHAVNCHFLDLPLELWVKLILNEFICYVARCYC